MVVVSAPELTVHLGMQVVRRIALDMPEIVAGRSDDNGLVLADPEVSRRHLRLLRQPDGTYVAEDLGSVNGTWVGDQRIHRALLVDGLALRAGPFTLVVRGGIPQSARPVIDQLVSLPPPPGSPAPPPPAPPPGAPLALELRVRGAAGERRVRIEQSPFSIGRSPDCDLVLPDGKVSGHHAPIEREGTTLFITDRGSTNGTFVNGARITRTPLQPDVDVRIGDATLTLVAASPPPPARTRDLPTFSTSGTPIADGTQTVLATGAPAAPVTLTDLPLDKDVITIGRDPSNDLTLPNPLVSRRHARLRRAGATYVIDDLGSTNGTFVNGTRITSHELKAGDQIQISVFVIAYSGMTLQPLSTEGNIRLDAIHLNKWVSSTQNILQDISLSISPREFVALVGISGAGKSTLMDALNGFRPTQGSLLINGDDLYANFDAYRTALGYVPQDDIIHRELPVERALDYAAKLRLPADTTPAERRARIDEVLKELNLTDRRHLPIHRLSGGQRKRVSIGVELLTKPSLFFLDEPTSGLDPGTETRMMRLLRQLADQGRTIILITHATQNVMLCDQVIFLAKGGNLAWYGPPDEALAHFGVERFDEIYDVLEAEETTPEQWAAKYRECPQYRTFVEERLVQSPGPQARAASPPARAAAATPGRVQSGATVQRTSFLRQFLVLLHRNADILVRDRSNLITVILQAIVTATLIVILFPHHAFSVDSARGDPSLTVTILFILTAGGIFIGLSNAVKELIKEVNIYRRERAVNLKIGSYVASKYAVLGLLGAVQSALVIAIVGIGGLLPRSDLLPVTPTYIRLYVIYFTMVLVGISIGLLVSGFVSTQDAAVASMVLVYMPQLMFSGSTLPIARMGAVAAFVSRFAASRWGLDIYGNSAAVPRLIDMHIAAWQQQLSTGAAPPVTAQTQIGKLQTLSGYYREGFASHVWIHWLILFVFIAVCVVGIYFALRRKDHA
jgi:ABC-type multidrug transport system ATPase subunit/pSer/pThr/pTyr-binding forkhead associated (FHA) protein